jgi:hypothetical protein
MKTITRTTYMLDGVLHVCGSRPIINNQERFMKEARQNKYSHLTTKRITEEFAVFCNGHQPDTNMSWFTDEITGGSFLCTKTNAREKLLSMRSAFGVN